MKRRSDGNSGILSHFALYFASVSAFGFADGFTAMLMMEKFGASAEFNPFLREIFMLGGCECFLTFKVATAALLLFFPLALCREMRWTSALFFIVFIFGGSAAAMNNAFFIINGYQLLTPEAFLLIFFSATAFALKIGEALDENAERKAFFKISEERWEQMKRELGIYF